MLTVGPPLKDVSSRTALITGANRGLGLEVSRRLLASGMNVVLACRDVQAGDEALAELDDRRARVERLDVADAASVADLLDRLAEAETSIDVLVNNAGVRWIEDPIATSDDVIARTFGVNVMGPWRLCRALIPGMAERGYGRVVNVSSQAGSMATGAGPIHAAYSVSKAALNAMTVNLARVTPPCVKINAMCPGHIATRMGEMQGIHAPRTVEQGADTAVWLATLGDDGATGGFFKDRQPLAW
ncbi:MAG: SDR family NAD(P)-dependent oxidoreductase [Planctomycetota bacterium]